MIRLGFRLQKGLYSLEAANSRKESRKPLETLGQGLREEGQKREGSEHSRSIQGSASRTID